MHSTPPLVSSLIGSNIESSGGMIMITPPIDMEHCRQSARSLELGDVGEEGAERYWVATLVVSREVGPSPGTDVDRERAGPPVGTLWVKATYSCPSMCPEGSHRLRRAGSTANAARLICSKLTRPRWCNLVRANRLLTPPSCDR